MRINGRLANCTSYFLVALFGVVSQGGYAVDLDRQQASETANKSHAASHVHSRKHSAYVPEGYSCAWHDEFDGVNCNLNGCEIDPRSWQFQNLNVNQERMLYTQRQCTEYPENYNYCIKGGVFSIRARDEGGAVNCNAVACADDYQWQCKQGTGCADREERYASGRITSKTKVDKRYGYIEVAFRLPFARQGIAQNGLWPALFMLNSDIAEGPSSCGTEPSDRSCEVPWPTAGEIDILEYVSATPELIFKNVHWDPGSDGPAGHHTSCGKRPSKICSDELGWRSSKDSGKNFDWREWNVLGLEWQEDSVHWILNGKLSGTFDSSGEHEFDRKMHLIINMAVGGGMGGEIDISDWTDAFVEYAYIRWYQKAVTDSCGLN